MSLRLHYAGYPSTALGPPDPEEWQGPQGVPGPPGPAGGTFPDAPSDGTIYGRGGATPAWSGVLPTAGGTMTGPLTVTATGASTARSVQDVFNEVVHLADYGLATNAIAAWNAALARLPTTGPTGMKIVLPAGQFSVHTGPISKTIPANVTLTIEGQGRGVSIIYIGDDTDGMTFTLEQGAGLHLRGFSVRRGVGSPVSNHTAISVAADPAINALFTGSTSFRDLLIRGGSASSQFRNGLVLSGLTAVPIDNVTVNGVNATTTDAGDVGITLNGPLQTMFGVSYNLTNTSVNGYSCGLDVTGFVQGVFLSNCSIIGDYIGVRWLGVGTTVNYTTTATTAAAGTVLTFAANSIPAVKQGDIVNGTNIPTNDQVLNVNNAAGTVTLRYAVTGTGVASGASVAIQPTQYPEELAVTNSTFNGNHADIYCTFGSYVQVSNCVFLRLGGGPSWTGIDLENCTLNNVNGNQFLGLVTSNETGVHIHADGALGGAAPNSVVGNGFTSIGTNCINLSGAVTGTTVTANNSTNCTGSLVAANTPNVNAIYGNMFNGTTLDFTNSGSAMLLAKPLSMPLLTNATNDAAAASAGVPVGQLYRNGSVVQQRVA